MPDVVIHAAASADVKDFYKTFSAMSFTLLGFWWVVVQLKYKAGGNPQQRHHGYAVLSYFLLPGVMTMMASVNGDSGALWRLTFGLTGALGLFEVLLYATGYQLRSPGRSALRVCAATLYTLIVLTAMRPSLAADLGLGLSGQEFESILVGLLVVVGVNLAWFGITEPTEPPEPAAPSPR